MYIVIDKQTKQTVHINPSPLSQQLEGKEVYYAFDPETMEIGKTSGPIPEYFRIDASGDIIELSLQEKIEKGIIVLNPNEKIEHDTIVKKSLSEQIVEGLIELGPNQKLIGEEIVEISPTEAPLETTGSEFSEKSNRELLEEGLITLAEIKERIIQQFSQQSMIGRNAILPDYKIQNALLGIYDERTRENYKATVEAFRKEFYRLKQAVEEAETLDEIEIIKDNFPTQIVNVGIER